MVPDVRTDIQHHAAGRDPLPNELEKSLLVDPVDVKPLVDVLRGVELHPYTASTGANEGRLFGSPVPQASGRNQFLMDRMRQEECRVARQLRKLHER